MSTEATPLEPEAAASPLRVDAQRNLARILAAAREVFAELLAVGLRTLQLTLQPGYAAVPAFWASDSAIAP